MNRCAAARCAAPPRPECCLPRPDQSLAARVCEWLGHAAWLLVIGSGSALALTPVGPDGDRGTSEAALSVMTAAVGLVLVARLVSAMIAWRERRAATAVLTISIICWGIAASLITTAPLPDLIGFRAPGEGFFLGSYTLMAVFLILDTDLRRARVSLAAAAEATVTVGGADCLAGVVLLTPLAGQIRANGIGPLLALLYPLLDLLLASAVVGDLVLRRRAGSRPPGSAGTSSRSCCRPATKRSRCRLRPGSGNSWPNRWRCTGTPS